MERYRRSQTGYPIVVTCAVAAIVVAVTVPEPAFPLGAVALVAGLFWRLTVTVDAERVTCAFGFGLIRRSIGLGDIEDCAVIPHRWYWGYGIRLTPHGIVYTVGGSEAVQLTLRSGRRFSIGTSQPRELCEVVRRNSLPRVERLTRRGTLVP